MLNRFPACRFQRGRRASGFFIERDNALDEAARKYMTPVLLKTSLHGLHVARGGKMVAFAGYDMPVQYDAMGVLKEHLHTRAAAGLFDVSHMGQAVLTGQEDPAIALEKIVPGDICGLAPFETRYTVLLNSKGGIVDDLMVTRWDSHTLYLVVNAGCKDKDYVWIEKMIGLDVRLDRLDDRALLAVQGPKAEAVVSRLIPGARDLKFMTSLRTYYEDAEIYVSRSGYTGEDGFEISLPNDIAPLFAEILLTHPDVRLIGLGARDSLRLEAGLCLYGHDLDDHTTPVEANLKWVIPPRRREERGFCGEDVIMAQLENGADRLRVGIRPEGRAPVREGTEIYVDGRRTGTITSGGFGPTVDGPVAMGYVDAAYAKPGTKVEAMVRGVPRPCEVVKLPFVAAKYKKG